ncbi:murein L,D-transpeptidase [Siculibacillus lacustris]|uniref:Murein L,D-transpeptidase n=1 Tax=Siculibacillus lacustris TaxID=1549641 RepID=A0A4V2KU83_9HYPH|nr:murein L,D-transpeptidase family protein [Siculibacillus lacustris]TBW40425.1 murein L,D-transpeptidase [Siculibacillus lacustris]
MLKSVLRVAAIASVGLTVASCQDEMQSTLGGAKAIRPLKAETVALMDSKGMRKEDPILVRAFKQEATLEIWKRDKTGTYAFLKSYPMCSWGGTVGPKIKEGDKQSPEGFYTVTPWRMNPNSQFHLAYDIGYPNAFDRALGRTGAAVMVHGNCTGSAGCFVMTDEQVEEIYGLAREALAGGQKSFQVQAFPFRMTAENLARHRRNPNMAFWKNIKKGYDHFEVTHLEPKVDVCDRHYVFDAKPKDPLATTFNPTGACPTYEVAPEIATAVAAKETQDDQAFRVAVAEIEDADRKETERMVAEKFEKSKPQGGTAIAAWFGAPAPDTTGSVGLTPIDVPLPKASPSVFAGVQMAAAATEPAPAAPTSGGLTTHLFGFGATSTPDAASSAIDASAVRPIDVPVPAARPGAVRTAAMQSAVPAPVPVEAPAEDRPLWKRINPFGG